VYITLVNTEVKLYKEKKNKFLDFAHFFMGFLDRNRDGYVRNDRHYRNQLGILTDQS